MSTIQVDRRVKKELFAIAADLQRRLGRKTSLSDAVHFLIKSHRGEERDIQLILSLFGSAGPSRKARLTLANIRKEEADRLERIARKHSARL